VHVDISRASFDPDKHFTGVIPQQGRVTLDADSYEQTQIFQQQLRTVIADLLGAAACPDGFAGFAVTRITTNDRPDLALSAGRMYVDGIMVENPATTTTYFGQPDGHLDPLNEPLPTDKPFVAYLRVFERAVTALQDPDIREIALGDPGPDTAARAQLVWQVAVLPFDNDPGDKKAADALASFLADAHEPRGLLAARARHPGPADLEPCTVAPDARFRGPENQLYRVEIHTAGVAATETATGATFVWSRENGSVALAVTHLAGAEVTVTDLGRDGKQGIEVGDWVQLVDDASAARAATDTAEPADDLFQVRAIDTDARIVTLDRDPGTPTGADPRLHPLLRRWDHRPPPKKDAIELVENVWIPLEDGVEVRFSAPADTAGPARYRTGDHWLVPARTVPGDVLWPRDAGRPRPLPPHGIDYHYAPLAYVPTDGNPTDLRVTFRPRFVK
jgi:hypothetical protein